MARCSGNTSGLLGIDRDQEHYNSCAAAEAGVGAPVIDYRPDLGILLLGYLNGTTLCNDDFHTTRRSRQGGRRDAQAAFRTAVPRHFDMFAKQSGVPAGRAGQRLPDPRRLSGLRRPVRERAAGAAATDQTTVPCNNDLLAANFVEDGDTIWLIDYEYSGNNDPCFELGNTWRECQLSDEQREELVTAYYGRTAAAQDRPRPAPGHRRDVRLDAVGLHSERLKPTGLRLLGMGHGAIRVCCRRVQGPDFTRLLDDVQASD